MIGSFLPVANALMLDRIASGVRALSFRRAFGVGVVVLAMLLAAVLALAGLSNQLFWDDEANTAIYARNLLKFGRLTAWDGRNLVGYSYGGALGEDLGRELRVAPLPAYVAAAGLGLFPGTTFQELTFSGRIPFVIAGVLSVGLLAIWLRRHLGRRFPWYLPSLILALSPAYLLYIRNCRYYALGVMFTLLVWVFWAPGSSRGRLRDDSLFGLILWLLRGLGGAIAIVLLILSHYLNAAAVLVTLPLFFLDPRYRQPRQYVLLGVIYAAAVACGVWVLATANPFAAQYQAAEKDLDRWVHFGTNAWWFVRDLGTHEFFPWCLVPVFGLPWLLLRLGSWWPGLPVPSRRLRSLARRGWVLVAVVLAYVVLAALLTPSDMGKGPTAEMRYVVPLIPVGSAVGGLAVVILWQLYRPLAAVAFGLLVMTNLLHLGPLAERFDETRAWWPPALYRYVQEAFHDYQTGNEEMIGLLAQLPPGTTVRIWDVPQHSIMVYPAMFYVPKLRYCDQLEQTKKIRVELVYPPFPQPTPDYLLRYRSRPEVWLVTPYLLREALDGLRLQEEARSYQVKRALRRHWYYTSKPEIPAHFFSPPPPDWHRFPGMAVLALSGSPAAGNEVLGTEPGDAAARHRLGIVLAEMDRLEEAVAHYAAAVRLKPAYAETYLRLGDMLARRGRIGPAAAHYGAVLRSQPKRLQKYLNLGNAFVRQGTPMLALPYYRAILQYDSGNVPARVGLGIALSELGEMEMAVKHYRRALRLKPKLVSARVYLAEALDASGETDGAIQQYREALRLVPEGSSLARQIKEALRRHKPELSSGPEKTGPVAGPRHDSRANEQSIPGPPLTGGAGSMNGSDD